MYTEIISTNEEMEHRLKETHQLINYKNQDYEIFKS
jgi:hypothetical protein